MKKRTILNILIIISVLYSVITQVYATTETNTENISITLTKSSKTLYVKETYNIEATVKNSNRKTTFSSSNTDVASVSKKGLIRALKKGKAEISVINNGEKAKFTVTVKNPVLNANKKTITKGKTFKITIKGQVGKSKFKSNNPSVATVSKNGKVKAIKKGKATITIKTNGNIKLKCKITVKNPSKWNLVKYNISLKKIKNSITTNIGEGKKQLVDYFSAGCSNNLDTLLNKKKITYKQYLSYQKRIDKKDKTIHFKLEDDSIGTLSKEKEEWDSADILDVTLKPKKKGTTNLIITYVNKTLTYKYTVTKLDVFAYKNKKSKAVYTVDEAVNVIKEEIYNRYAEGIKPQYTNIVCYFDNDDLYDVLETKFNKINIKSLPNYKIYFDDIEPLLYYNITRFNDNKNHYIQYLKSNIDEDSIKFIINEQNLYKEANRIIEEYNVNGYSNDYEKIIALSKWFDEVCEYDYDRAEEIKGGNLLNSENIILSHKGVCMDYASATEYFCKLLNIPCLLVSSKYEDKTQNHAWNVVKIQGKWYHLDILWSLYFLGSESIKAYDYHTNFCFNSSYSTDTVTDTIIIETEDFVIPKS